MAECLLPSGKNNTMAIKIINFFIGKGLTPNQALGICANVYGESSYRTTPTNGESGAYGLFQWTGSRKRDLKNFCEKNGLTMSSADAQLAFAWHENDRNVWQHYAANRGMTAMQSLDYWEDNWERCYNKDAIPGQGCSKSKEACCRHKARQDELEKLINMYQNNQKSDNCSVSLGAGGGEATVVDICDPTSMAYYDDDNGSSDEVQEKSVKTMEGSYQPTGINKTNTKPVLFGGSWAYKMSPYFNGNGDYYTYTVWQGLTNGGNSNGDVSSFMGTYVDRLNTSSSKTTIGHIRNYMSFSNNKPTHIIVTIDRMALTYKKNASKSEILKAYKNACIKFFSEVCGCCYVNVIVPLRIDSWANETKIGNVVLDYTEVNNAIKQAASAFYNVKIVETPEFYKGTTKPSNGILPEDVWSKYSKEIKQIALKIK